MNPQKKPAVMDGMAGEETGQKIPETNVRSISSIPRPDKAGLDNLHGDDLRAVAGCEIRPAGQIIKEIIDEAALELRILRPDDYALTEVDNGRLFVDLFGRHTKFDAANARFLFWDGTRFATDRWGVALQLAAFVGKVRADWTGHFFRTPAEMKAAAGFAARTLSAAGIRNTLFLASGNPQLAITPGELDVVPYFLNTPRGIIDLRTGVTYPHTPGQLVTKITRFSPGDQGQELWSDVLSKATCGRQDLAGALQRFLGSGLVGSPGKDKFGIAFGHGANMKSTLTEAVADAVGDYAGTTPMRTFSDELRASGHTEDLAALRGVRFLRSAEPSASIKFDEGRLKELTGGESIAASHKHGRSFTFLPSFSLFISTNHKPKISGRDSGIWRRVWFFSFDYTVPEGEREPNFKERLVREAGPAIMAWLVQGAQDFIREGWGHWPTVEAATAEYRADQDTIGRFLADCCVISETARVSGRVLRAAFDEWLIENGDGRFSNSAWAEALRERGFSQERTNSGRFWRGLMLQDDEPPF